MSMTMAEKILARASGQAVVSPGDLVVCNVDLAVQFDASFTGYRMMGAEPAQVFDPDHAVPGRHRPRRPGPSPDHAVPAVTVDAQDAHARMRSFAAEFHLTHCCILTRRPTTLQFVDGPWFEVEPQQVELLGQHQGSTGWIRISNVDHLGRVARSGSDNKCFHHHAPSRATKWCPTRVLLRERPLSWGQRLPGDPPEPASSVCRHRVAR
jgi:hypothetical protein